MNLQRHMLGVALGCGLFVFGSACGGAESSPSSLQHGVDVERLSPALDAIVSPSARVETIYIDRKGFYEGPTWVPGSPGYLVFSDIPGNVLYRTNEKGKLSIFESHIQKTVLEDVLVNPETHRRMIGANGTTLDPSGELTYCVFGGHRIERIDSHGHRVTVVSSLGSGPPRYPNDLVYRSDGALYFSENESLYLFAKGKATRLDGPAHPNGMALSPDERYLYATDHPATLRRYEVAADGTISKGAVFFDLSSDPAFDPKATFVDGVKVDKDGDVFAVGAAGVWILTPDGVHIGTIRAPEVRFTNLAFGGRDGRTLFLTAPEGVYRIQLAASRIEPGS